nr:immunoglobulin heavy chain junction region [Macaca mulatta]
CARGYASFYDLW